MFGVVLLVPEMKRSSSVQVEFGMSSESLLLELEDLARVGWADIWKGPPLPGHPGFDEWCARYEWKPQTVERDLKVLTRHGNVIKLAANGHWDPVVSLKFFDPQWRAETSVVEEKMAVVEEGVAAWQRYTELVSGVWGELTWSGAAGDSDFPESPVDGFWWKPETAKGNPFRLSLWEPSRGVDGPVVLLTLGVAGFTWDAEGGAASVLKIAFCPPAEAASRG
ncbi:hypothetical protein [Nocardiopsis ganjiahuensis]|uniref:hypothetical protein n=1 Tax=Nocardiopsis ganjiahuensis TaxID=239984 RepID=UPI001267D951|nr:hypothetical protein [Nocardiopsis ganjiahuensis]